MDKSIKRFFTTESLLLDGILKIVCTGALVFMLYNFSIDYRSQKVRIDTLEKQTEFLLKQNHRLNNLYNLSGNVPE